MKIKEVKLIGDVYTINYKFQKLWADAASYSSNMKGWGLLVLANHDNNKHGNPIAYVKFTEEMEEEFEVKPINHEFIELIKEMGNK